jgi:hypothetical protein
LIASIILFGWKLALGLLGIRLLTVGFIFNKAMKKMDEKDLWPWFIFLDLWMFFYYIIFVPALWKKPTKRWN